MDADRPRRRSIVALLAADAVSLGGNAMAAIAIPWFVLDTTGSASKTGIVAAAALVPIMVSGLLGGPVVDRVGFRRTSVIADVASAVTVAAIPLLHAMGVLVLWQLAALVFVGGLLDTPGASARTAMLPEAAREARWSLERTTGAAAVIERGSRLLAAPVAGVLLTAFDARAVLWIDASTFVASGAIVLLGVRPHMFDATTPPREPYLADVRAGFAHLRNDRVLLPLIAVLTTTNMLDAVSIVALPVYAREVYGSALSLGALTGAISAGSIVGALMYSAHGAGLSRRRLFGWGLLLASLWYVVAVATPPLWVFVLAMVIAGTAAGPVNPIVDTLIFERVPGAMRGRVLGVVTAVAWGAVPLGVILAGPLVDAFGMLPVIAGTGVTYAIAASTGLWLPALRGMDRDEHDLGAPVQGGPSVGR